MRVSLNWLSEWVNTDLDVEALCHQLTFAGLEVDQVETQKPEFTKVFVAEVKSVEPHPSADRLHLCHVDAGQDRLYRVVCGANNVYPGMKVPMALVGARLGSKLKIRKSKIRGEVSEGMLCSAEELGLNGTTEGLLELPHDAPVGKLLEDYLELEDVVIDIDLTPNRGDCLSILGVAREIAALNGLAPPKPRRKQIFSTIEAVKTVHIKTPACPRYCGRVLRKVNTRATTPMWMQRRLEQCNVQPIHPIVDVTNYVMLELGQPLHAFDESKLQGDIVVRYPKPQETLVLLDGQTLSLGERSLVIADETGPVALAGIMGGGDSAVTTETEDVFVESAYFDPVAIAYSAQSKGINTDSSFRFERGVDWELPKAALERATELLLEIVGGEVGPIVCSETEHVPERRQVYLALDQVQSNLGVEIQPSLCDTYLEQLQMQVETIEEGRLVEVPSFRFDITRDIDLIEEIARLYGYNNIPTTLPVAQVSAFDVKETRLSVQQVKHVLNTLGYHEVINYAFTDQTVQDHLYPNTPRLRLVNPIAKDLGEMRAGLWPGLLSTVRRNQYRQRRALRFFELGTCFSGTEEAWQEIYYLSCVITAQPYPDQWAISRRPIDFYDLKGDIQTMLDLTGTSFMYKPTQAHPALHPGKAAAIYRQNECIGYLGELHPRLLQYFDLQGPVLLAELKWEAIAEATLPTMKPISKYPRVKRDLAFVVDDSVYYGDVEQFIWQKGSSSLKNIQIFDIYQGDKVSQGKKSFAVSLYFQDDSRTLTDEEVNTMVQAIAEQLQDAFAATLRGPAHGTH